MEEPKKNKGITRPPGITVLIRFKPGRGADGVAMNYDGTAEVDRKTAEYLIGLGYAEKVQLAAVSDQREEKGD